MQALLDADEERLRHTLRANDSMDKNREVFVETLHEELGGMLLRYNAACAPDRMRQALAESLTATARDSLDLLKAGGAEKEVPRREISAWASLLLLIAVGAAAAGLILIGRLQTVGMICLGAAVLIAYLSGRLWFKKQKIGVRATLDADKVWYALRRMGETMDRKIDEFCERADEWRGKGAGGEGAAALSEEELRLFGDLLEALYAANGEFALRQLEKLRPCLRSLGLETADYDGGNAELFEFFPSLHPGLTLRPAILAGEKLVLAGRATDAAD